MLKLLSVNAFNLYASDDPGEAERFAGLEAFIRDSDADVIAVQEIIADGDSTTGKTAGAVCGLNRLADAVGRQCRADGRPAVATGGIIHHTGLLWRDSITVRPGTLHPLTREGAGMWHCAISAVFDVGGPCVRIGSVQLSPFDQGWAKRDTSQLLRVFNRGDVPGLLGGDFNGLGSRHAHGSDNFYDPDPYAGVPWRPDFVYQLDDNGNVDRGAAIRLESPHLGRMRDCALITQTPWTATTGHHPVDAHPPRRIDRWYATHDLPAQAVTGFHVADAATIGLLTDHLPITVEVDPQHLANKPNA